MIMKQNKSETFIQRLQNFTESTSRN